jgi:hypothetical protein
MKRLHELLATFGSTSAVSHLRGGYCWRTYFHPPIPTFMRGISTVLSLQRSHRQGAVFDPAEFANSIGAFVKTADNCLYSKAQFLIAKNLPITTGKPIHTREIAAMRKKAARLGLTLVESQA